MKRGLLALACVAAWVSGCFLGEEKETRVYLDLRVDSALLAFDLVRIGLGDSEGQITETLFEGKLETSRQLQRLPVRASVPARAVWVYMGYLRGQLRYHFIMLYDRKTGKVESSKYLVDPADFRTHPAALFLSQDSLELRPGETAVVPVELRDPGQEASLVWASRDSSVAAIGPGGKLTAVGQGRTQVTVISEADTSLRDSLVVDVRGAPVRRVGVGPSQTELSVGESMALAVLVEDFHSDQGVKWISQDASVLKVDPSGAIKGLKAGRAFVIARSVAEPDKADSAEVQVQASRDSCPAASLRAVGGALLLSVGDSAQALATVAPACARQAVVWISRDRTVAEITPKGELRATGPGRTFLIARAASSAALLDSLPAVVTGSPVRRVVVGPDSLELRAGDSATFRVEIESAQASRKVVWESLDTAIAKVRDGRVNALRAGRALIIVRSAANPSRADTARLRVLGAPSCPPTRVSAGKAAGTSGLSLTLGDSAWVVATVEPACADPRVIWMSSDIAIAKVDAQGKLRSSKPGQTFLLVRSASDSSLRDSLPLAVATPIVSRVVAQPDTVGLALGDSTALRAWVEDYRAGQGLKWTSLKPEVVKVDSLGRINGLKVGPAFVVARSLSDTSKADTVLVRVEGTPPPATCSAGKPALTVDSLVLTLGDSAMSPSVRVLPACADQAVKWSSSDTNVIEITTSGKAFALKAGSARLYAKATVGGAADTLFARVYAKATAGVKPRIVGIRVDTTVSIRDTVSFWATVTADSGGIRDFAWDFDGNGLFDVSTASSARRYHAYPAVKNYRAIFRATHPSGQRAFDTVNVNVVADPPTVDAGPDQKATVNDPVRLQCLAGDRFGFVRELEWKCGEDGFAAAPSGAFEIRAPARPDTLACVCKAVDDDGYAVTDTLQLRVTGLPPRAVAPADTTIGFGDRLELRAAGEDDGAIRRWEWIFPDGSRQVAANPDATYAAPAGPGAKVVPIILRVWDDDGMTAADTLRVTVTLPWKKVPTAPAFPARQRARALAFQGKLWLIGGEDLAAGTGIWSSPDGKAWKLETTAAGFLPRQGHALAVFKDRLWVLGGSGAAAEAPVWSSAEGLTWEKAPTSRMFPAREGHTALVFRDSLWVMGGRKGPVHGCVRTGANPEGECPANYAFRNDVWKSGDGVAWVEATDPLHTDPRTRSDHPGAPVFTPREGHASAVYGGKMWVIGGAGIGGATADAWTSADGREWTCPNPRIGESLQARDMPLRHHLAALDLGGKLWIMGGAEDVWTWDGAAWMQATSSVPFAASEGTAWALFNGSLWSLGGSDGAGNLRNDAWSFTPSP